MSTADTQCSITKQNTVWEGVFSLFLIYLITEHIILLFGVGYCLHVTCCENWLFDLEILNS